METGKVDDLLPYFRKGVNFTAANPTLRLANATVPDVSEDAYSSSGGPLEVSCSNYAIPFDSWTAKAFKEVALPEIQDFVSGRLIGAQYTTYELDPSDETRSSSKTSYLDSALSSKPHQFAGVSKHTSKADYLLVQQDRNGS
jgi:choline dehydrogenase